MNKPWDIVVELEKLSGTKDKEAVIMREVLACNDEFFAGFNAAMNSYVTYGIKKIPVYPVVNTREVKDLSWKDFKSALDQLAARKVTGHAARDLVLSLCHRSSKSQWDNWYARILRRDMKCGCTDGKINKQVKKAAKNNKKFEKYVIPVFSCQLAQDSDYHGSKMTGRKMIQIKLDGVRVLTKVDPFADNDDLVVQQFSRSGKDLVNFPHIVEQFRQIAKTLKQATVFDGEVMSENFRALMTQLRRKSDVKSKDAILNLFDIIPWSVFLDGEQGIYHRSQQLRYDDLQKIWDKFKAKMPNVTVLDYEIIDFDTKEGRARYKEINKIAIANGFEGIMIKDLEADYKCKRGSAWLKLKPKATADLTVVDTEEGKEGVRIGNLGKLICEGDVNGKFVRTGVGSGFSEQQYTDFWKYRKTLIGQVVEVEYDCVTQNAVDAKNDRYSLRFPVFVRFRGFEPGEKL